MQPRAYRGSRIVPVRIDDTLLESISATITRVNKSRRDKPFTVSSFIRKAIEEKLHHYQRSNPTRKEGSNDDLPRGSVRPETGID